MVNLELQDGPIDEELLRSYLVPALNQIAEINRSEGWPGRAKVCELSASWLLELLRRERIARLDIPTPPAGRRRFRGSPDDADDWLAAMERDIDSKSYLCRGCGDAILPGDRVGANQHGITHARCSNTSCPELT